MLKPVPRFIITCHGRDITRQPWGDRAVYGIDKELTDAIRRARTVVAISRHARQLLEELGVPDTHITDIPNGVDLERFSRRSDTEIRHELGLPGDAALVISVGRNHPAKDLNTGLKAFAQVARHIDNVHYLVIGRDAERLSGLARQLGIQDRVSLCEQFLGAKLVAAYQQSDVYLSSSISETFPLTLLESMATGSAPVVTQVGGHEDLVVHGENGVLTPPGDVEALADALTQLLQDSNYRARISEAARQTAQGYSWKTVSQRYLELA
jgi:glycosyltransferase involved in cell wall biosynthesis